MGLLEMQGGAGERAGLEWFGGIVSSYCFAFMATMRPSGKKSRVLVVFFYDARLDCERGKWGLALKARWSWEGVRGVGGVRPRFQRLMGWGGETQGVALGCG